MSQPNKPRVFFGTMYSNEAEFEESKSSVLSQTGLSVIEHATIFDLPEKEAHNTLWREWEERKHAFDLFVKIDADTVLRSHDSISRVWELFAADINVTGAQLRLHDYFTNDLIAGLNFFTPVVNFSTSPDLYCDRVDTNHNVVLKGDIVSHLEPIGFHCKNPNAMQSFHFGLHRMLKNQVTTLKKVWANWQIYHDSAREFALVGAAAAAFNSSLFAGSNNGYKSSVFLDAFKHYSELDHDLITSTITNLQSFHGWVAS